MKVRCNLNGKAISQKNLSEIITKEKLAELINFTKMMFNMEYEGNKNLVRLGQRYVVNNTHAVYVAVEI